MAEFVLLAAGGTGGHLFPAEALAAALAKHSIAVELATDSRAAQYATHFPARRIHALPAATPSGGSAVAKAGALMTLARGTLAARSLLKGMKPSAVVGFGGYPSVPPVLAGTTLGIPTIIHEQNAVIGRANRFLSKRVSAIATGFAKVGGIEAALAAKSEHVGNPVRPAVLAAAAMPFMAPGEGGKLRLLVFGGSQGARVMSEIVPVAVPMIPEAMRARLAIVQQARPEDAERVRGIYAALKVEHVVEPFFSDLPARMAEAHLVVARSGASTVAELGVIGRPSILVPLPGSLDQDQAANAASLEAIGAASVIMQAEFTPQKLANEIILRLTEPAALTRAAAAAKSAGIPDAADRLAAFVVRTARLSA